MAMPLWILVAAAIVLTMIQCASAQDRPLLEQLRIGFMKSELMADHLQRSASLTQALRRKGFVVAWREYDGGLAAIRSLHTGQVDIALNIPLIDVISAKRENLKMVFIAELRSIAPSCCDIDKFLSDQTFKRYTLSGEYLADYREDIFLILHQQMLSVLQNHPAPDASELTRRSRPVRSGSRLHSPSAVLMSPVTRELMVEVNKMARERDEFSDPQIDLTDINYWMPGEY
jgi:hypothetical protein